MCPHNILSRKKEPEPSICRVLQIHVNSFIWHYHIFVTDWVWTRCPWKIFWILPLPNSCSLLVCRIQASLDWTFAPCHCQHWAWSLRKRTNPNESTIVKCVRVGRAVPCDSSGFAALKRGVCALCCCLSKKSQQWYLVMQNVFQNAQGVTILAQWSPAVDIYYGHCPLVISHLKTQTTVLTLPVTRTGPGVLGPEAKQQGPALSALYGLWASGTAII